MYMWCYSVGWGFIVQVCGCDEVNVGLGGQAKVPDGPLSHWPPEVNI